MKPQERKQRENQGQKKKTRRLRLKKRKRKLQLKKQNLSVRTPLEKTPQRKMKRRRRIEIRSSYSLDGSKNSPASKFDAGFLLPEIAQELSSALQFINRKSKIANHELLA